MTLYFFVFALRSLSEEVKIDFPKYMRMWKVEKFRSENLIFFVEEGELFLFCI